MLMQEDKHSAYFGCIVGRVANRIKDAQFSLDCEERSASASNAAERAAGASADSSTDPVRVTIQVLADRVAMRLQVADAANVCAAQQARPVYKLEANDGANALHGGSKHWGRRMWALGPEPNQTHVIAHSQGTTPARACFRLTSEHGDGGYPGELDVSVTYRLYEGQRADGLGTAGARLEVDMNARAAGAHATPVNMVQHTHWNLAGKNAVEKVRLRKLLQRADLSLVRNAFAV